MVLALKHVADEHGPGRDSSWDEKIRELRRAWTASQNSAEKLAALGDALEWSGREAEAEALYRSIPGEPPSSRDLSLRYRTGASLVAR